MGGWGFTSLGPRDLGFNSLNEAMLLLCPETNTPLSPHSCWGLRMEEVATGEATTSQDLQAFSEDKGTVPSNKSVTPHFGKPFHQMGRTLSGPRQDHHSPKPYASRHKGSWFSRSCFQSQNTPYPMLPGVYFHLRDHSQ